MKTNLLAALAAVTLAVPMTATAANAQRDDRRGNPGFGKVAGPNPWDARGLEWTLPSPPTAHNFEETPIVTDGPYEYELQEGPSV